MLYKRLTDFKLNAYYPFEPLFNHSVETNEMLSPILNWIDAKVPGSIHHDLMMAGVIRDPYYEMQSMESEWVSDRWWVYKTRFQVDTKLLGKHIRLRLQGVDYKAHVELNGTKLGCHEGMYTPFVRDITAVLRTGEENDLRVTLENAPDEMGQIGYTDRTFTQKARFTYKWDWSPRLVQLGLYDDVQIEYFGDAAIEYAHLRPVYANGCWTLETAFEVTAFKDTQLELSFRLTDGETEIAVFRQMFAAKAGPNVFRCSLDVGNPKLWYPLGHGEQPLYTLETTIKDSNGVSDYRSDKVGFRTLDYIRCEGADDDSLPYNVVLNGKRIYLKGVNFSPLDVMYGCVTEKDYEDTLALAKSANINLIRVWGGGLIEKEIFYSLCDRLGILVWQEFIQSSSGISNVPSKRPEFLALALATAEEAVKTKRNHVCLTYWSGGNELTNEMGVPATFSDENLSQLRNVVERNDPDRLMLPTSASGPKEFLSIGQPGQNHDVHGPWKYQGPEEQYRLFNCSDSQLHSEFGVDGAANLSAFTAFASPANRIAVPMSQNLVLRHHGAWWDTYERDSKLFGQFKKDELPVFIQCSQFIQAEGIRYALEANRRRMFSSCGSIIWQFNEPWPNASGTNVVDYFKRPKLAYYFMRDAYRPITPSLRYDKLIYTSGAQFHSKIFVLNDLDAFDCIIHCTARNTSGDLLFEQGFQATASANGNTKIADLNITVPEASGFIIELELVGMDIFSDYLFLTRLPGSFADRNAVCDFCDWYLQKRSSCS